MCKEWLLKLHAKWKNYSEILSQSSNIFEKEIIEE